MYRNDALVFESCMHKNIRVYLAFNCLKMCNVDKRLSQECSATGMGQFPIWKLKWDLLRTSVTAYTIDKNKFSTTFGICYVRTEI